MNSAAELSYQEIVIGKIYEFNRTISRDDILAFAKLTGDFNPLHVDEYFGKNSNFKQNIVHGMLVGSLFSTLVGMYCPGKNSLYLGQTLNFKQPVYIGDTLVVRGMVLAKNDSINLVTLKTEVCRGNEVVVTGEAKVKVL